MSAPDSAIQIDPRYPNLDNIKRAADCINQGGILVFPTWCFYGVGADAFHEKAVNRVFQVKERPADKPLLILIKGREGLKKYVQDIPEIATKLMNSYWPGKLTLVFRATDLVPEYLTSGTGKIGIRVPENRVAQALLFHLDKPITGTSANISGISGCSDIKMLDPKIRKNVDLILDSGILKGKKGSTVVDITCDPPIILREGAVSRGEIEKCLKK